MFLSIFFDVILCINRRVQIPIELFRMIDTYVADHQQKLRTHLIRIGSRVTLHDLVYLKDVIVEMTNTRLIKKLTTSINTIGCAYLSPGGSGEYIEIYESYGGRYSLHMFQLWRHCGWQLAYIKYYAELLTLVEDTQYDFLMNSYNSQSEVRRNAA